MSNDWRVSSFCNGGACVEIGAWRTSTACASNECVEVGSGSSVVGVRDKALDGSPVLKFSSKAWAAFCSSLRKDVGES